MVRTDPRITVLMSVYNGEKHLSEAIDSILQQTFTDFEFLIIDDGSLDNTRAILQRYSKKDGRIRVVRNDKNLGLTKSLNLGIDLAKGEYIARMDADDISLPTRFARQVAFMDTHPKVGVVGSYTLKQYKENSRIAKNPCTHEMIHAGLLTGPKIFHPTAFIRAAILRRHHIYYTNEFTYAQDFDLWVKIAKHADLANIPEVLCHQRIHENSISNSNRQEQDYFAARIRQTQLEEILGTTISSTEYHFFEEIIRKTRKPNRESLEKCIYIVNQILKNNMTMKIYDNNSLNTVLLRTAYSYYRTSSSEMRFGFIKLFLHFNAQWKWKLQALMNYLLRLLSRTIGHISSFVHVFSASHRGEIIHS